MKKIKNTKPITRDELNDFMNSLKIDDWYVKEYIGMPGRDDSWGSKATQHKGGSTVDRAGIPKMGDFVWAYEVNNFSLNYSLLTNIRKPTDEEIKMFEERKAFFERIVNKNKKQIKMRKFKLVLGYLLALSPFIAIFIYALIAGKLIRFILAIGLVAVIFVAVTLGVALIQNNL